MDQEKTSMSRPPSPKSEPIAAPNEAELSRIAREAVHQPADPRLDRQLARMGVVETAEPAKTTEDRPDQSAGRLVVAGADVERLASRLRRVEMAVGLLAVAVAILAVVAVVLLAR